MCTRRSASFSANAMRGSEVVVDGVKSTASSVIVANGRYYAGRYSVAPAARLGDPVLYVCLQRRGGAFSALKYSIAMVLGLVHRLPDVDVLPAESVGVYGPEEQPVQADGDIVGYGTHRISARSRDAVGRHAGVSPRGAGRLADTLASPLRCIAGRDRD